MKKIISYTLLFISLFSNFASAKSENIQIIRLQDSRGFGFEITDSARYHTEIYYHIDTTGVRVIKKHVLSHKTPYIIKQYWRGKATRSNRDVILRFMPSYEAQLELMFIEGEELKEFFRFHFCTIPKGTPIDIYKYMWRKLVDIGETKIKENTNK